MISRNPGEERHLKAHRGQGEKLRIVEAASDLSEGIFVAKEINRRREAWTCWKFRRDMRRKPSGAREVF